MRRITLLVLSVIAGFNSYAQETEGEENKKIPPIYMQAGAGPNWESKTNTSNMGHGIHLAENTQQLGYYVAIGGKLVVKKKLDFNVQLVYRTQLRDKTAFNDGFEALFPNKEVLHHSKIGNIDRFGIRFALAYIVKLNSIYISPKISVGCTFGPTTNYEYVLRTPGTNYFDRYHVINRAKAEYPVSIGFNLTHSKLKWLELVTEFGYSKNKNNYDVYKVEIDEEHNAPVDEAFHFDRNRLYFCLGLNFKVRMN